MIGFLKAKEYSLLKLFLFGKGQNRL